MCVTAWKHSFLPEDEKIKIEADLDNRSINLKGR